MSIYRKFISGRPQNYETEACVPSGVIEQARSLFTDLDGDTFAPHRTRPWGKTYFAWAGNEKFVVKSVPQPDWPKILRQVELALSFPDLIQPITAHACDGSMVLQRVYSDQSLRQALRSGVAVGRVGELAKIYGSAQVKTIGDMTGSDSFPRLMLSGLVERTGALAQEILGNECFLTQQYLELSKQAAAAIELLEQYSDITCIEHGDYQDNNYFWTPTGYRLGDWSDARIAHPFFSLITLLSSFENAHKAQREYLDLLREGYIECWQDIVPDAIQTTLQCWRAYPLVKCFDALESIRRYPDIDREAYRDIFSYWVSEFAFIQDARSIPLSLIGQSSTSA